jgi:hypothetical protein
LASRANAPKNETLATGSVSSIGVAARLPHYESVELVAYEQAAEKVAAVFLT